MYSYYKNSKFVFNVCIFFLFNNAGSLAQTPYFQQEINYKIQVTLNDRDNELNGDVTFTYKKNSTSGLDFLYIHLWPNAYKNNNTALCKQLMSMGNFSLYNATPLQLGYIDQLDFSVNGSRVKWKTDSTNIDIAKIFLAQPLSPGDSLVVSTPFHVKIPDAKFSRLGHVGESYMITQWFPKPAVYDRNGWHPMPYLNQGEFFSEFGTFDVSITLPENYVIAATGDLQTTSEIKKTEELIEATAALKSFGADNSFPPSSSNAKTVRYTISNVHDFAWFADKRFHVTKKTITLERSGKQVDCYAYFTNAQANLWKEGANDVADAVNNYSKWVGDYPYSSCTAVDGTISAGGGMEYPMITNIGEVSSKTMLTNVIAHEVGQNWFYGILANNERDHPWMDEGINSFYESRYMNQRFSEQNYLSSFYNINEKIPTAFGFEQVGYNEFNQLTYLFTARHNNDQPSSLPAEKFTPSNYATDLYVKTSLCFGYLKNYLGDSIFDSAMQQYFDEWKFKHPSPADLKNTFKAISGKDLNWFFEGMLNSTKKIDFKISQVKKANGTYKTTVTDLGNSFAPYAIGAYYKDSLVYFKWIENESKKKEVIIPIEQVDKIVINPGNNLLDFNEANNTSRANGAFKTCKPLRFSFGSKYERPEINQIFYLPSIGYNNYDGFMAGILLHNVNVLKKQFEYAVAPLYGFQSKALSGSAYFNYSYLMAERDIDKIDFTFTPKRFSYEKYNVDNDKAYLSYYTLPFSLSFRLQKLANKPSIENNMAVSLSYASAQVFDYLTQKEESQSNTFVKASYLRENFDKLDPGYFTLTVEGSSQFTKTYFNAGKELTVGSIKKAFFVNLFAGVFLSDKEKKGFANFQSAAWRGDRDYSFDEFYFGRSERNGYWSQQMVVYDGGLKTYYPLNTNKWMLSLNSTFKLPLKIIKVFADGVLMAKPENALGKSTLFLYDGGVCVSLMKDAIEVYFPLFYSSDIKDFYELNNYKLKDKIRFVLNIKKLHPIKIRDAASR